MPGKNRTLVAAIVTFPVLLVSGWPATAHAAPAGYTCDRVKLTDAQQHTLLGIGCKRNANAPSDEGGIEAGAVIKTTKGTYICAKAAADDSGETVVGQNCRALPAKN